MYSGRITIFEINFENKEGNSNEYSLKIGGFKLFSEKYSAYFLQCHWISRLTVGPTEQFILLRKFAKKK